MTTVKGETITGIDLSRVELISNVSNKKPNSVFTKEDLAFQESRKNRKVRKLEFDIK